jgi:glycosyltransferase involved in cell wall biosynthesis
MLLSVVIPARDVEGTLSLQLDALLAQDLPGPWEIIVVDNGSIDATPDIVRAYASEHSQVRLLVAPEGRGCGFGRNRGAAVARSNKLAFCDGDDVVGASWVSAMYHGLDRFAYVTGPLDIDELNDPWLIATRGRWVARREMPVYGDVLPFAIGCNIGVRREVLDAVGGFNETMSSGEDIEFAMKLRARGVELGWQDSALIRYRYRPEWRVLWRQGRAYGGIQPELAARLRRHGLSPRAGGFPWQNLASLVRTLAHIRDRGARGRALWLTANTLGHLEGLLGRSRPA